MQSLQEYAGAPHNKGTLALVFTDIVGSTDLNSHFGDDDWLSILLLHFERARELIEINHGYLIKFIGDSCMVAFRTTLDAFRFSVDFYLDTGHPYVTIKAGFHFGSVLIVDDDVYGSMVNLTSRIQHSCESWGIAMSDPAFKDVKGVRGRSAPKIGERATRPALKGFPTQIVWQISTDEMQKAETERKRERRKNGIPQQLTGLRPGGARVLPQQPSGGSAAPPLSAGNTDPMIRLPRFNPYRDPNKK
jgi:class 3 adenylate cyclase